MDSNMNNNVTSMTRSKQKAATAALSFNEMHEMMKSCQRLFNCHGLQSTCFTEGQRWSMKKMSLTFILCGLYPVQGTANASSIPFL